MKDAQLHLKLDPKVLAAWKAEAKRLGITVSAWLHLKTSGALKEAA